MGGSGTVPTREGSERKWDSAYQGREWEEVGQCLRGKEVRGSGIVPTREGSERKWDSAYLGRE